MVSFKKFLPERHLKSTVSGISMMIALASLSATSAIAQNADNEAGVLEEPTDVIVVIGSRRPGRTAVESNVPIDVIEADVLERNGYSDINRKLQNAIPSFNYMTQSLVDGTEHIKPATLRGLAPDQVLVLINGKRRHVSALLNLNGLNRGSVSVDLNSIPSAAIQRIEVLRDGAAAQYGSDAIAGVINIVTKTRSEGGSLSITGGFYATTMQGVPQLLGIQSDANGVPIENGSIRLARIDGDDIKRTDGENLKISGNYGLPIGDKGYINLTGEYHIAARTDRAGQDDGDTYPRLANGERDPRELTTNRDRLFNGSPSSESYTALISAGYEISDAIEFYSTTTFQNRDASAGAFFREASDEGFGIQSIYPDGFTPRIHSKIDDLGVSGGFRGEVGGWSYDASAIWGRNKVQYNNTNTANITYLENTPTEFYGGALQFIQRTLNVDFNKLIDIDSLATPLSISFGAEQRRENYRIFGGDRAAYTNQLLRDANGDLILDANGNTQNADALLSVGSHSNAQGSLYFKDTDEVNKTRSSVGLYAEVDADITDRWNVTLAGRYEDYTDFGSTFNGKIASRFELTDDFAIRGSFSTGFRAPSLHQQFFTSTVTVFTAGIPADVGTLPSLSPAAMALGGTQLQAENATNYSSGFIWQPTSQFTLTVDAYRIDVKDRIVLSETLGLNAATSSIVQSVFAANGITDVGAARFFINGVNSKTQGVDATAVYSTDIGEYGDLSFSAGFNYNKTEISDFITTVGPSSLFPPEVLFSYRQSRTLENSAPKTKANFTVNWDREDLSVIVRANYYGSLTAPGTTEAGDVTVDTAFIIDTDIGYQFTEMLRGNLGINNVFDKYSESRVDAAIGRGESPSQFNYLFPYFSASAYGFQGRYLYAGVTATF